MPEINSLDITEDCTPTEILQIFFNDAMFKIM
jgi:hypothetical protein